MSKTERKSAPPWERRLYLPTYTVGESARYAGTHPQTVAYWHHGPYAQPARPGRPSLKPTLPGRKRREQLSWLQLVEVAVVATFRNLGVPLNVLRDTHAYAVQHLKVEYPFAHYEFKLMGWEMILAMEDVVPKANRDIVVVTSRFGQTGWTEMLNHRFLEFDYDHGRAIVWRLGGDDAPHVTLDPRVNFGAPTVDGVPVWVLAGRVAAGWDAAEIADEYGIPEERVTEGTSFAERFKKAA